MAGSGCLAGENNFSLAAARVWRSLGGALLAGRVGIAGNILNSSGTGSSAYPRKKGRKPCPAWFIGPMSTAASPNHERLLSTAQFKRQLEDLGFEHARVSSGSLWHGIPLRDEYR